MNEAGYPPSHPPSTPLRPLRARLTPAGAAAALVAALVLQALGSLDLWDPDEANYAEIAREMATSGDWIVPHSNFRPYLEKPPLVFWIAALAMRLGADGEAAARLPAALAGLALIAAVAVWARRALPQGGALACVLVLGTSLGFLTTARLGILDLPLTACVTLALLGFERRVLAGGGRAGWICFYAGMAAGCLVKGLLGLALPLVVGALAAAWVRPPNLWRRLDPLKGAAVFLVLVLPWFAAVAARAPGFLDTFLFEHHLLRFAGEGIEHRRPVPRWAYLLLLAAAGLPWSFLWPGALLGAGRRAMAREPLSTLLLIAGLFPLLFFSLSATRLPQYALPSLPPLCVLLGRRLVERCRGPQRLFALAVAGGLLFVGLEQGLAAPINFRRSLRPLAEEVARRAHRDEPILSYRIGRPYASVFYARRRVRFMEEEVTFDQFISAPARFWILIDEQERAALELRHRRPFPPHLSHGGRCLITNRPPP